MRAGRKSETWIEHALRRARWQPQRQVMALGTLGFSIALILGALYLSQVVSEATMNRELTQLLEQRDELERRNEQLRADIANARQVTRLQTQAEQLGFVAAGSSQIEYLPIEGYNPAQEDTVAPIEANEEDVPVYDETFTGWLEQQWDSFQGWFNDVIGGG